MLPNGALVNIFLYLRIHIQLYIPLPQGVGVKLKNFARWMLHFQKRAGKKLKTIGKFKKKTIRDSFFSLYILCNYIRQSIDLYKYF